MWVRQAERSVTVRARSAITLATGSGADTEDTTGGAEVVGDAEVVGSDETGGTAAVAEPDIANTRLIEPEVLPELLRRL